MFGGKRNKDGSGGKRRSNPATREKLQNLGLVPNYDGFEAGSVDNEDDEADLEAELQNLMYGGSKANKPKKKKNMAPEVNLDAMVASCMEDIPSGDEDLEGDDDPELLDELAQFDDEEDDRDVVVSPIQSSNPVTCDARECAGSSLLDTIEARINMYTSAERSAKQAGESARARRFSRGLATLTDMRRKVVAGKAISEDDIPPIISSNQSSKVTSPQQEEPPPQPQPQAPTQPPPPVRSQAPVPPPPDYVVERSAEVRPPTKQEDQPAPSQENPVVEALRQKRAEYRIYALEGKKAGDKTAAVFGLSAVKQCEELIQRANAGECVDISVLPKQPTAQPAPQEAEGQGQGQQVLNRAFSRDDPIVIPEDPTKIPEPDPETFGAPPPPVSVDEALAQRLAKYKEDENKARSEGNQSRVRRLGRICKQYEEAIKLHKRGKLGSVIADLPCPPGFGPIPFGAPAAAPTAATIAEQPQPASQPQQPQQPQAAAPAPPVPAKAPAKRMMSLQDKQYAELQKRQAQFKKAALEAKKAGQIVEAKEYLRQAKGFDKLIEAAQSGLPVDFKTLPVPPQQTKDVTMDFEIVSTEECTESELSGSSRSEMYVKLEKDLLSQVKMCTNNRHHFKSVGDVASMNKFQQMEEHTKKDLDSLRFAFKRGAPVPKFHYEVRSFSKVVCCSDLTDNELEFIVERGTNFNVANPKELHSYCKLEFPYPKETPFKDKSATIKDTNNPEYSHSSKVPLNVKDKSCARVFKRSSAKVEIWSKVGFLRSDILIGTASIKLQPLETKCEIHDSFALMDGRRAVGGQVEVKIRIRNPIVAKQIEKVEEKWLVISF